MLLIKFEVQAQSVNRAWSVPSNLGVLNSNKDDFAPHYNKYLDLLYFNSDRDGKSYFYFSIMQNTGSFNVPKILNSVINVNNKNQSYITCPSEKEAYFSSYRKSSKQSYLNIFRSTFQKNNWTEPLIVDSIAFDGFCSHPTVSPDGKLMVFSSDRLNSNGDIDLWMSFRNENGYWSSPISINELNSQGNEITPYLHTDDTLYFASDGYEGPGAFDIYFSVRSGNLWERPRPLFDFNTEYNESDFTILPDGRAVFASDRPGGLGGLDLYISSPQVASETVISQQLSEISIRTQVSNIIAEKHSVVRRFPSFYFFVKSPFVLSSNTNENTIDSLLFEYPKVILNYMLENTSEIMVLDSTSSNVAISSFFISKGIEKDRIIFQKSSSNDDVIKCKLLSGNALPDIEIDDSRYNYKPPVLEISVEARENLSLGNHSLDLITSKAKHKITLNNNKLPLRDILPLEEYESEIYYSDSILINYKISLENQIVSDAKRIIFVNKQQFKEPKVYKKADQIYEEYFLIIPDKIFFDPDYISKAYLDAIRGSMVLSNSVKIIYYSDAMQYQAGKIKELLTNKSAVKNYFGVEKNEYKQNETFSKDLSSMIIKIVINKKM